MLRNALVHVDRLDYLRNTVVVAQDEESMASTSRLRARVGAFAVHQSVHANSTGGDFGSEGFSRVVVTRPLELVEFLVQGFDVVYNDADIAWLRLPFYFIGNHSLWDVMASVDDNGDGTMQQVCSCFVVASATARATAFMQSWAATAGKQLASAISRGKKAWVNDQWSFTALFRAALKNGAGPFETAGAVPCVAELSPVHFPNGNNIYHHQRHNVSSDAVIVHANWVVGREAKIEKLRAFGAWIDDERRDPEN